MRYRYIKEHSNHWSTRLMCRIFDILPSAYYAWDKRPNSYRYKQDEKYTPMIRKIFEQNRGAYGAPRITEELRALGHRVNHKHVARLLSEMGLAGRQKKKFKPVTTLADVKGPVFPDLIKQDFSASEPNKRWVGDITYLVTSSNFEYLATVIDLFSRKIVGWSLSSSIDATLVTNALLMAVRHRNPEGEVIFHSDRGSQYTSKAFMQTCLDYGVQQSMGRTGCCYDNAAAESFFHSLKVELLHGKELHDPATIRSMVFEYIETYYNRQRRHSSIGYLAPENFEKEYHKKTQASRHDAPPRSAAKRAPDAHKTGPNNDIAEGSRNHRQSAIRPPIGRLAPAPPGCLLPTGTNPL